MNNELMFSSRYQAWDTPQDKYDELNAIYNFTLDAAASYENHKCDKYFTEEENGLEQSWAGEVVFINPPYGREYPKWIKKAYEESINCITVMVIASRTGTKVFHKYIWDKIKRKPYEGVSVDFQEGRWIFGSDAYWEWLWEQEFITNEDGTLVMTKSGKPKRNPLYQQYGKKNAAPFDSLVVIFDRRNLKEING